MMITAGGAVGGFFLGSAIGGPVGGAIWLLIGRGSPFLATVFTANFAPPPSQW